MDPLHPPVPPVSARNEPRFRSAERKSSLAEAFADQGEDYDRLRPGYPGPVIDAILSAAHAPAPAPGPALATDRAAGTPDPASTTPAPSSTTPDSASTALDHVTSAGPLRVVDLGAGTGKLSWALVDGGCAVTAVDTSEAMLETARRRGPSATSAAPACSDAAVPSAAQLTTQAGPSAAQLTTQASSSAAQLTTQASSSAAQLTTHVARAESTGLPAAGADLVTVAQAWHWFDAPATTAEVARLLAPGGVLALVWNTMDVTIPWVHRLSRIMHAGDVQREDFLPTVGPELALVDRVVHRWEDPLPTHDLIDLARTRSYVITATEERRQKVLANLDWYLHEHLGHAPGSVVGLPYRTDLFVYRLAEGRSSSPTPEYLSE
ncbi:class I SAM-dependent methyltransferase [Brachybacterium muris]|uniref:Ubiquinone biosynthesis protein n=1 Tax=Brachybacterium muris UCD-AY4 TaxID=1249481 RepID=A0A022KWW7_9MICO|nr:methyltransferase domain-containing protein [Brachybacterium muris]EYT49403.1 ubiquinone biosynthesis protein [Brachybacterium muris UCD-AY4]